MRRKVLFLTSYHTSPSSPLLLEDVDISDIGIDSFIVNGHAETNLR